MFDLDHHHPITTDDDNVYLVDDPEDDVWSWLWPYLNTTQVKKKEREERREVERKEGMEVERKEGREVECEEGM